jgi:hypothetical protein
MMEGRHDANGVAVYIYQDKVPAALRSVVHTISLVCTMALYVLAGNEMRNRKE